MERAPRSQDSPGASCGSTTCRGPGTGRGRVGGKGPRQRGLRGGGAAIPCTGPGGFLLLEPGQPPAELVSPHGL